MSAEPVPIPDAIAPALPRGVTAASWAAIGAEADGDGWQIPERDAEGGVVGWARRFADGSKGFVVGGHRGLTYSPPFPTYAGSSAGDPVFIVEGQTDTATGLSIRIDVIGRPAAQGGGDHLAMMLKGRHVCFVAENDGEQGPGARGAQSLAQRLVGVCESVRVIYPPADAKDLRAWVLAGADRVALLAAAAAAPFVKPKPETFVSSRPLREGAKHDELAIVSIADFGPATDPDWLWHGYIARGHTTLLTGLWKGGKSTLLGHLLRDLYRGGGLVPHPIDAPTLIVSEEAEGIWARRRDELGLSDKVLFARRPTFTRPDRVGWLDLVDQLCEAVRAHDVGLVVFDTLPSAWCVLEENNASEMLDALTPLRALTEAGAGVLLVCHPRKGGGGEGTATRGSGALPGFADILVELKRHNAEDPQDRRRVLTALGRFEATPPETVIELGPDGYTVIGDRLEARSIDVAATVRDLLPEAGPGWTWQEVADDWPTKPRPGQNTLRGVLNAGVRDGAWKRSGTGHKGDPWRYWGSIRFLTGSTLEAGDETNARGSDLPEGW